MIRIGRTLPPAAAPIYIRDIFNGLKGLLRGQREIERFKSELKAYFGVKHCFLLSSGKAALAIILRALKAMHPEGDEVLIPAFTCYSVPSAIVRAGLKVRLCDIDENTLDFDFNQIESIVDQPKSAIQNSKFKINNRILAVIPTHLFGLPSDILRLRSLVTDPDVTIVEDAAQAMGGESKGHKLGTLGDVSFLSLGRGKALSTVEGGIILTNRDEIALGIEKQVKDLSVYGPVGTVRLFLYVASLVTLQRPNLFWIPASLPFLKLGQTIYDPNFPMKTMSPFQAGLARDWKKKLEKFKAARACNEQRWTDLFGCPPLSNPMYPSSSICDLCDLSGEKSSQPNNPVTHSLLRFPVRISDHASSSRLLEESKRQGMGIAPIYPDSINGIPELKACLNGQEYPVARRVARSLVTLPNHPLVSDRDVVKIKGLMEAVRHEPSSFAPPHHELSRSRDSAQGVCGP